MPVICIGPVCIPLHLLVPFLLGLAHQYGWLRFIKREWVTWAWWRALFRRWLGHPDPQPAAAAAGGAVADGAPAPAAAAGAAADGHAGSSGVGGKGMRVECTGDVCRLVPTDDGDDGGVDAAAGADAASAAVGDGGGGAAAKLTAAGSEPRQRKRAARA